jgi:Ni/Fe-hydrogenase subunit HybB-like protein
MAAHAHERPLGGPIVTSGFRFLLLLCTVWVGLVMVRLIWGLNGPFGHDPLLGVSAQSDGYAWGIWKPLNVVTFTGIAAGAFAVGLVTYGFNRGEYHPLVRSCVMAGAMGYTLGGTSIMIDLGRYWNLWVIFVPQWLNWTSVLLEIALCVLAYTLVLWVEVAPSILEKLETSSSAATAAKARRILATLRRVMPFVISLAILLPAMHQSSLGGLFMVAVTKTHPYWHTGWLPALFLLSCLTMGFGAVVVIENLTALAWKKQLDQPLLARLSIVPAWLAVAWLVIRVVDVLWRFRDPMVVARHAAMGKPLFYGAFFLLELAIFAAAAAMLFSRKVRENRGQLFGASLLLLFGGALYRFGTYLVAYQPAAGWKYFPTPTEILFSITLAAIGITVYVLFVKLFPILSGVQAASAPDSVGGASAAGHSPREVRP